MRVFVWQKEENEQQHKWLSWDCGISLNTWGKSMNSGCESGNLRCECASPHMTFGLVSAEVQLWARLYYNKKTPQYAFYTTRVCCLKTWGSRMSPLACSLFAGVPFSKTYTAALMVPIKSPVIKTQYYKTNAKVAVMSHQIKHPLSRLPLLFWVAQLTPFRTNTSSHLLQASIGLSFPGFREERCPGGEVLLKLGVGVLFAAVAAAGGAAPGHLERRSFVWAASLVCHYDYSWNRNTSVNNWNFIFDN